MSKRSIILLVISTIILICLVLIIFIPTIGEWIKFNIVDLILAAILAIIAAILVEYLYKKNAGKSNLSRTTINHRPQQFLAKLSLKDNKEFIIDQYERIFGREDFIGLLIVDELAYIGKQHFKLTRLDDGFYIEDLDTKNGTVVNNENISGLGKIKLKNEDEIIVAKILEIRYLEEESQ